MVYNKDGAFIILQSEEELNNYLKKYNCDSLESLEEALWYTYGVCLTYRPIQKKRI